MRNLLDLTVAVGEGAGYLIGTATMLVFVLYLSLTSGEGLIP